MAKKLCVNCTVVNLRVPVLINFDLAAWASFASSEHKPDGKDTTIIQHLSISDHPSGSKNVPLAWACLGMLGPFSRLTVFTLPFLAPSQHQYGRLTLSSPDAETGQSLK